MRGKTKVATADLASIRVALSFGRSESGETAIAWLERALRLAPGVPTVAYLAGARMVDLDPARARAILADVVASYPGFRESRLALAMCLWKQGEVAEAEACLDAMLTRFAPPAEKSFAALADAVCAKTGRPGWIGVDAAGGVRASSSPLTRAQPVLTLDGARVARGRETRARGLPAVWRYACRLEARIGARVLLGSPVDLAARRRVDGVVDLTEAGELAGWAWFPADPDRSVTLTVRVDAFTREILARDEILSPPPDRLLDRPRRFSVRAAEFLDAEVIRVTGPDGSDLAGSPLYPGGERAANRLAAQRLGARSLGSAGSAPADPDPWRPLDAGLLPRFWESGVPDVSPAPVRGTAARRGRKIDVVIPVWRGADDLSVCLKSLAERMPAGTRIVVVDDASDDAALRALLDQHAAAGHIMVVRHAENRGFPAAANTGMRHALAEGRDVLLLNSDTLMPPGGLARLARLAYADETIGSVTAMSNDGTLVSHPSAVTADSAATVAAWDRLFLKANGVLAVDLPTAVGFCMYIRADCLRAVGLFREDAFAQGYGEENDWSFRARHLGFRHVAAAGVFVAHRGGRSFGAVRQDLMRRNRRRLNRLHPGYDADVESFAAKDPLGPARRAVDAARWAAEGAARGAGSGAVIMLTHGRGGGVNRYMTERARTLRRAGYRPVVLTPDPFPPAEPDMDDDFSPGVRVDEPDLSIPSTPGRLWLSEDRARARKTPEEIPADAAVARTYAALRFALPDETDALVDLLAAGRPARVELHHFMGHTLDPLELAWRLNVPLEVFVHDSAAWCPRVTMFDASRRYCGEPADIAVCAACARDLGGRIRDDISVPDLRARSAAWLAAARRVVVSCDDAARRISRQFPGTRPEILAWEDDVALLRQRAERRARAHDGGARARVVVAGGIGPDKGFSVLLDCARDAAARDLPLEFIVVGYSGDDARLLETGRVFVTGRFADGDGPDLVAAQRGRLGFIPSVVPETWCYALSVLWAGGLKVATFALGAQAERVARAGTDAGAVLPLGLPASRVNELLLALARVGGEK